MNKGFINVPFKTESGLSSVNGMAKFSAAGVVLEFESKLFGLLPGRVKEVRIPITEILDIKFNKGLFKYGSKITLRTKTFSTLAELPNQDGKLTLNLVRDDFERGRDAVHRVLEDMNANARELPGSYSPVGRMIDETEDETKKLDDNF